MPNRPLLHVRRLLTVFILMLGSVEAVAQHKLPVIQLAAGMHIIQAEVAANEAARRQGLMFRQSLGQNEGMLFVFDRPAGVCMWMKDTPLPLSVAFIDQDGKIVNIEDMQPNTTESHCAKKLIRYALEMNQGWFKQKNIKPGTAIQGLPK